MIINKTGGQPESLITTSDEFLSERIQVDYYIQDTE